MLKYGKCRQIYHTWMLWVRDTLPPYHLRCIFGESALDLPQKTTSFRQKPRKILVPSRRRCDGRNGMEVLPVGESWEFPHGSEMKTRETNTWCGIHPGKLTFWTPKSSWMFGRWCSFLNWVLLTALQDLQGFLGERVLWESWLFQIPKYKQMKWNYKLLYIWICIVGNKNPGKGFHGWKKPTHPPPTIEFGKSSEPRTPRWLWSSTC